MDKPISRSKASLAPSTPAAPRRGGERRRRKPPGACPGSTKKQTRCQQRPAAAPHPFGCCKAANVLGTLPRRGPHSKKPATVSPMYRNLPAATVFIAGRPPKSKVNVFKKMSSLAPLGGRHERPDTTHEASDAIDTGRGTRWGALHARNVGRGRCERQQVEKRKAPPLTC